MIPQGATPGSGRDELVDALLEAGPPGTDPYSTHPNVRSSEAFMAPRRAWQEGSALEVYSVSARRWCRGEVHRREGEMLQVRYLSRGEERLKGASVWSPLLRSAPHDWF